jgi:alpha-L-rhamnosidase
MGLLNPYDWTAKWIGFDDAYEEYNESDVVKHNFNVRGLTWMRGPGKEEAKSDTSYLRSSFDIPKDRSVRRVTFVLFPDNEADVKINDQPIGSAYRWEHTTHLDATSKIVPGKNIATLTVHNTDPETAFVAGKIVVEFNGGDDLEIPIDNTWKASKSPAQNWEEVGFDDSKWDAAVDGGQPYGTPGLQDIFAPPAPYLRDSFTEKKQVKRATLYCTALGVYEMHINGQRVGSDYLEPGWTDFRKRVYHQTYDVTHLLKNGENVIGAILGDGWYSGCLAYTGQHNWYGGPARLLAQLEIEYTDGSKRIVGSGDHWKAIYGPIQKADLLLGCIYDGRKELSGWDLPGYSDAKWSRAYVGLPVNDQTIPMQRTDGRGSQSLVDCDPYVLPDPGEPSRIIQSIHAVKVTEPRPGCYTFDLGQNMVGWTKLTINGIVGQKITVRHGEMLNPDGTVYLANLRSASGTDEYYLGKNGVQTVHPYFTSKGFRYVEVRGLTYQPTVDAVVGEVVHSDMQRSGSFDCSSPLINQLYHNIVWGQKGNYLSVPTDCPQRDERAGWTGDAEFFVSTAAYNFNIGPFMSRWLTTLCQDSQLSNGALTNVAPNIVSSGYSTAWGEAGIHCTYRLFRDYNDTQVVRDNYDAMGRLVDFIGKRSKDFIPNIGGYGDWLDLGGGASREVIDTAYYAVDVQMMSEMAESIGKHDDAVKYANLHSEIVKAFQTNFIGKDGSIKNSSQTGYALAYTMGLVPDNLQSAMSDRFAEQIKKFKDHLATGFIGTPRLLPALHLAGRDDLAYKVLNQEDYPGWLYQVKLGATTMWERWDGWTPEKGFQTVGMNSFNHYSFGAVGEYLYSSIAGIRTDGPGYDKIVIQPIIGGGLTFANGSYDSLHGKIQSSWKLSGSQIALRVVIPANTTATVYVPSADGVVTESGVSADTSKGVRFIRRDGNASVYEIGSGSYRFESTVQPI